jgi:SpoIIAA-like
MSVVLRREAGDLFRLDVQGSVRRAELERSRDELGGVLGPRGSARLLVVLNGFMGWAADDDWSGLDFLTPFGDQIARMAIVGDPAWRDEMLLFVAAGLRRAPVEFFVPGAVDTARAWLTA